LKLKKLAMLAGIVALIFVMVTLACNPAPGTTPTTKPTGSTPSGAVDTKFNCLSPVGIQPPVTIVSLAARLDTIKGKVIYVNQGEADPVIMPALWERVQKDYPDTTWKLIASSSFGPASPEDEVKQNAKAVIRGVAW
jgi:hypothetical protein